MRQSLETLSCFTFRKSFPKTTLEGAEISEYEWINYEIALNLQDLLSTHPLSTCRIRQIAASFQLVWVFVSNGISAATATPGFVCCPDSSARGGDNAECRWVGTDLYYYWLISEYITALAASRRATTTSIAYTLNSSNWPSTTGRLDDEIDDNW